MAAVVGAKDVNQSEVKDKNVTIYFGVFFDGTNNHRLQVLMGKKYREKTKNRNESSKSDEYENDEKEIESAFTLDIDANDNYIIEKGFADKATKKQLHLEKDKKGRRDPVEFKSKTVDLNSIMKDDKKYDKNYQTSDYTNVALLETFYKAKDSLNNEEYAYRIYVSGCGMDRDIVESDNSTKEGAGLGVGIQGVKQKVIDAVNAIKNKLTLFGSCKNVKIQYHIFGFSRGAAEARILANILSKDTTTKQLSKDITKRKTKSGSNVKLINNQSDVRIPFVGIFDTVSSIGVPSNHDQNIKDYGLNVLATSGDVENIFHICALDEFRSNFSLTPVRPKSGKLLEIYLPGAHADIGGGYAEGYSISGFCKKSGIPFFKNSVSIPEFPTKSDGAFYEVNKDCLEKLGWLNEIEFVLVRDTFTEKRTLGKMYVNGEFLCDTLEDKNRKLETAGKSAKIYGQTAIPKGRYRMTYEMSPKFKNYYPRLQKVPYFEGVLIHAGKTEDHTQGCILVGSRTTEQTLTSGATIMKKIRTIFTQNEGAEFWITVVDKDEKAFTNVTETDESIIINRFSKKGYSYIPLHLMLNYACEKVKGIFEKTNKFECPDDLQAIKSFINGKYKANESIWPEAKDYKWLREKYLHFSSQVGFSIDGLLVHRANIENNKYIRRRYE